MAKIFRRVRGDNHLLMFLQNISRPVPVDQKESGYHLSDTVSSDAFAAENPDPGFDMKKVEIVFKLAKVKFHFMYFPIKGLGTRREIEYVDHNSDLYDFFSKITKMTGGIKLTSANPSAFIKGVGQLILTGTVEVEILDEKMEE
ncbi:MAG: hypothetical protein GY950_12290 [bacterium]|nr:hypothetical protein [bacterium]